MHLNNLSGYQECVYHTASNIFFSHSPKYNPLRIAKGEKKIVSFPPGGCECNQGFNDLFPFGACLPLSVTRSNSEQRE